MDTIIIPIFKSLGEVKKVALVTELVRDTAGVLNQGQSVLETMLLMAKLHCWKELGRHVEVGTNLEPRRPGSASTPATPQRHV